MDIILKVTSFFILLWPFSLSAQSSWKELTSAELVLETNAVPANDPFELGFLIQLKPGWHTYWQNSGDSGAGPRFDWKDSESQVSGPIFPVPERFEDQGIVTFGYKNQVLFVFKHSGLSEGRKLKLSAEWLVCKDICLPALAEFEIEVGVKPVEEIHATSFRSVFEKTRRLWPLPHKADVLLRDGKIRYSLETKSAPSQILFFPYRSLPYDKILPIETGYDQGQLFWEMSLSSPSPNFSDLGGVVEIHESGRRHYYDLHLQDNISDNKSSQPIWWFAFLAFVGGLILNLMPCVFPILSLKLFGVLKTSGYDSHKIRMDNLAYVGGVIFSFLLLGSTLSFVRELGVGIGWGFQLQSPAFVGGLILLFVLLALEMFGFYTFDLIDPSKGQKLTRLKGFWGSFFTGVLAVIVASPCSAPFMGAAVGAALTQAGWVGPFIFFMLGLGLAFPYLLLAISPSLLKWVPRPGAWMKVMKELMAFPLLLTALWLLWLFVQIGDSQSLFVLGVSLIGIVFSLWLSSYSRKLAWLFAFVFIGIWILYGIFGRVSYQENSISSQTEKGWVPYSASLVQGRLSGEVYFVNMTADWCITCKVNEKLIFTSDEVDQAFQNLKVTKVKGDWTKRDPEITRFLDRFGRAGVPFYVIYSDKSPNGEVLSEVLTKENFIEKLRAHASKGEPQ